MGGGTIARAGRSTRGRNSRADEVLAAAWALAAEEGVGGFSLRAVARRVGLSAPSLYEYFPSKAAIHDAMFADGWRSFVAETRSALAPRRVGELEADLVAATEEFLAACRRDLPRYQLLFTRVVPGWEPSREAYAESMAATETMVVDLAAIGVTDPTHVELYMALGAGLAAQQAANDPEGTRTAALVRPAVEMFVAYVTGRSKEQS